MTPEYEMWKDKADREKANKVMSDQYAYIFLLAIFSTWFGFGFFLGCNWR
jgi:hypothetical protein